ncbi:hypothetical protein [Thermoflavimicrobium daqui]|uniref:DUF1963 domain-containing protein n=1 Tax=Thermoflavimicrobium daqui TaxID=2137476 RepID=A0A364K5Y3_9BACL|nr:hypothetical protein [Thermoflavimicrobium daqui]RAL25600.1 hypothetical protein DL897_05845 [Thermoflavimicrobium daqui]
MRYYVPELYLGTLLPGSTQFVEQYGGLPWGLAPEKWPNCKECGKPMSLIAQFCHHKERLNLGKEGRVLYLFQCEQNEGNCATWDADCGANAVVILEPEQVKGGTTFAPLEDIEILPEARIVNWIEKEDGVPNQWVEGLLDGDQYHEWFLDGVIPEEIESTKLGGFPEWLQWPQAYGKPYYFAGQIDSGLKVMIPPEEEIYLERKVSDYGDHYYEITPNIGEKFWVYMDQSDQSEEPIYSIDFANFADSGIGYLFIDPDPEKPKGKFLWQCL